MSKNAIIFDLDGTLWDVTEATFISANEITKKYGLREISVETVCNGFGTNKEESAKLYFPDIPLEEALKYIYEIGSYNIDLLEKSGGILFEDEIDVLRELSNDYDLYIVSNTSRHKYIEAFLNANGTKEYFKGYIPASALDISKSEAIKKIISDNEIAKAVYVDDTRKDQLAAEEAQIPFVHAKYGFDKDFSSEYSINEFVELPKIIRKIVL